jgi:hypothetical protein
MRRLAGQQVHLRDEQLAELDRQLGAVAIGNSLRDCAPRLAHIL